MTTIICGFILPRLILNAFGSEVHGLVNSIAQFLGVLSFLELGVGEVVEFESYKPLAVQNQEYVLNCFILCINLFCSATTVTAPVNLAQMGQIGLSS